MQIYGAILFAIGLVTSVAGVGFPIAVFGVYRLYKGKNLTVESSYGV
jgi:hypothetical protein